MRVSTSPPLFPTTVLREVRQNNMATLLNVDLYAIIECNRVYVYFVFDYSLGDYVIMSVEKSIVLSSFINHRIVYFYKFGSYHTFCLFFDLRKRNLCTKNVLHKERVTTLLR